MVATNTFPTFKPFFQVHVQHLTQGYVYVYVYVCYKAIFCLFMLLNFAFLRFAIDRLI